METKTHISVRNLNVYYGKTLALKNISVDIPDGAVTAIIGPSGCGKSTLLRTFNRLIDTFDDARVEGTVLVDGENIYDPKVDVTKIRQKMGLLSQRPAPLPMSIYDNVAYGPRIHGTKKTKELDEIVSHYLGVAGLWDEVKERLHTPASSLSLGQQQRLCLARGLAVRPEIILADEPTSALDPFSTSHIENKLVELKEKYTIIIVTHILRQARRLADYVLFVYLGELIEHGPAHQMFENQKEQKTRDYFNGIIS